MAQAYRDLVHVLGGLVGTGLEWTRVERKTDLAMETIVHGRPTTTRHATLLWIGLDGSFVGSLPLSTHLEHHVRGGADELDHLQPFHGHES